MPGGPLDALRFLRVVDLSVDVAGSYCTKLLADAGAEVVKVEPPVGSPLRTRSTSGRVGADGDPDGALFRYLAAGQRSIVADVEDPSGRARLGGLLAAADVLVADARPHRLEARGLGLDSLRAAHPQLVIVSITPFGLDAPRADEDGNDFLLQALCGALDLYGAEGGRPLAVGGHLGEWVAGAYAATGALAAITRRPRTGQGGVVDVSTLEAYTVTFPCYPSVGSKLPGAWERPPGVRMIPAVEQFRDGFVGLTTLTVQQWHDFVCMIGRADLIEDEELNDHRGRVGRKTELAEIIQGWAAEHTVAEVLELAAAFRIPASPVLTGETVPTLDQTVARQTFQANPRGGFPHPRPPFRSSLTDPAPPAAAPRRGEHDAERFWGPRESPPPAAGAPPGARPLDGVRVLDVTAFWAGPAACQWLAALGADVIRIESIQRPDPMRFNTMGPVDREPLHEYGFLYLAANLDKRNVTLNLSTPRGRDLFLELVATADVVIENFAPRVMENFDLTDDVLRAARGDLIYMRMPGWGLDGPWRDRPGFATTMEQASGMGWITGAVDGRPIAPGLCDPLSGAHGAFAILAALEERRLTGRGQHIEFAMIDMAVNVAAEQVLEYAAYGHLMEREGNRATDHAPQGTYPCAGENAWVAISVTDDTQWKALQVALGSPAWATDPALADVAGRIAAHDQLDAEIDAWARGWSLDEALGALHRAGVPAEPVTLIYDIAEEPQLVARRFFEEIDHPVAGTLPYPGWPMKLSGGPAQWFRTPAPTLGQHNDEILAGELHLDADELAELRDARIIGETPAWLL